MAKPASERGDLLSSLHRYSSSSSSRININSPTAPKQSYSWHHDALVYFELEHGIRTMTGIKQGGIQCIEYESAKTSDNGLTTTREGYIRGIFYKVNQIIENGYIKEFIEDVKIQKLIKDFDSVAPYLADAKPVSVRLQQFLVTLPQYGNYLITKAEAKVEEETKLKAEAEAKVKEEMKLKAASATEPSNDHSSFNSTVPEAQQIELTGNYQFSDDDCIS